MKRQNREYDQNIIVALKRLPVPLKTFDGHEVFFDLDKRHETIFEHVANKKHHLYVVDIAEIVHILKDPSSIRKDRSGTNFRTYIGKRGKTNEKKKYLKIVTMIRRKGKESIYSIYPAKTLDN